MGHLHCRRPGRNAAKDALGVSSSGVHRGQCHTGEAGSHQAGSFHPTGTCPGRSHRALQSSTFHMADCKEPVPVYYVNVTTKADGERSKKDH